MKFVSALSRPDHQALTRLHQQGATHRQRQRAHAVLLSAKGCSLAQIAHLLDTTPATVSRWLGRWRSQGLPGLCDAAKTGRPRALDDGLVNDLLDILASPSPNLKAALQADLQKRGAASAGTPSSAPSNAAATPSAEPATARQSVRRPRRWRATKGL